MTQDSGLRFGIVLFDGVEELDWVGPWEVITSWKLHFPDDKVEVFTMSPDGGEVRCAKGARVIADHSYENHPPIDVLIFPGGQGTRRQLGDENVRTWVRHVASTASLVTSVCTGALVLADAGLLDGRPATTHWASLDLLRSLGKDIDVRADDRFVDDGDIVTAAGVSAGIDMALHLVARLGSVERARQVRRYIQYDPTPPV
jgi:transcriptional regulator GlxA family with amidase domain